MGPAVGKLPDNGFCSWLPGRIDLGDRLASPFDYSKLREYGGT